MGMVYDLLSLRLMSKSFERSDRMPGLPAMNLGLLRACLLMAMVAAACWAVPAHALPVTAASMSLNIYQDGLGQGWDDWSWNTTVNWSDSSSPHAGVHDAAFTFTQGWDGLSLHSDAGVDTTSYDQLRFWMNGAASGGQSLSVFVEYPGGGSSSPVDVAPYITGGKIPRSAWVEVTVPLAAIGASATTISRIDLFNNTSGSQPQMLLDDMSLFDDGITPPPQPAVKAAVTVNATSGRHHISPYIYGVAGAGSTYLRSNGLTMNRWGGNPTSRYNWKLGSAMNTASDYYFENTNYGNACSTPGCAVDQMARGDDSAGAASLITVPTLGWVAKNASLDTCGFSVAKYGPQKATDPYRPNCGNGIKPNGTPITGNQPSDTSVRSTPADIRAWIKHLVGKFGSAARGGVRFYAMDNEPELWYTTHRDVAPSPLTYAGIYRQFETYATAVKSVDPTASVDGPVPWGWSAYFDSSYDYVHNTTSDRQAHGNLPIIPWFLKTVRAHDVSSHRRTLNVLDIHYYPQGQNVFAGATDPATDALRLRETEGLWNPDYVDESWINSAVDLIPRMHAWISKYYPGTKLGISEWNFGADGTMNGALAIANVLGTLGAHGVYLASYWTHPANGSPGSKAFDMFRNYDGNRSAFGGTSVSTVSSAPTKLMAFAAVRSSDGALTLMLVNQEPSASVKATIHVKGFSRATKAAVYRLQGSGHSIQHLPDVSVAPTTTLSVPASSITLLVEQPATT